jgi:hypothetical protein
MRPKKLWLLLTILFTVTTVSAALAVPTKLSQQGRLLDGNSVAFTGTHALIFSIYDAETGGNEVWREERSVDFEEGYYAVVLGELVPVDDLLFSAGAVWLELTVDGSVLSPRQEIVSVPWALRATSAEHVDGGVVEAAEISVGGVPVIDSTGTWIGPTPDVDWSELTGVPGDIADGDQDGDILANLNCSNGQVAKWDGSAWLCADDVDTTNPNTDTLAAMSCLNGQIARYSTANTNQWVCDEETVTSSLSWNAITDIPADIADGDQDSQLTEQQVEGFITNAALDLDPGTTVGGAPLATGTTNCTLTASDGGMAALQCGNQQILVRTYLPFTQVDSGAAHTCGIQAGGSLLCWGSGSDGRLDAPAGSYIQVSCGRAHSCALSAGGQITCWGENGGGQTNAPTGVFTQVSSGYNSTCALNMAGNVQCWGGPTEFGTPPTDVLTQISGGWWRHCGVLASSGAAVCWNDNANTAGPAPPGPFLQVSVGRNFNCAVRTDQTLACWGANNQGQATPPAGSYLAVSAGEKGACALSTTGTIACWGTSASPPPAQYSQFDFGRNTACGVIAGLGGVRCWGIGVEGPP